MQPYAGGIDLGRVLAIVGGSFGYYKHGVVLSLDGICLHVPNVAPMRIPYRDLAGAFFGYFEFEITFRNGQRIRFEERWVQAAPWELERILNCATGPWSWPEESDTP